MNVSWNSLWTWDTEIPLCAVPVGAHRCQFATCPESARLRARGYGFCSFAVSGLVTRDYVTSAKCLQLCTLKSSPCTFIWSLPTTSPLQLFKVLLNEKVNALHKKNIFPPPIDGKYVYISAFYHEYTRTWTRAKIQLARADEI